MQGSPRIDELRQKFHENPRRYFAPLANEYRKAGDPEQAIAICRAHLAQQPGHMSGHVVYAQALYDAGRTDESRVVFEKALTLDPDNAIVLRHLGDISRRRGETGEARHWYTQALEADPHDREVAAYIAELTEPLTESDPVAVETAAETPSAEAAPVETPAAEAQPAETIVETPASQDASAPLDDPPVAAHEASQESAAAPIDAVEPIKIEEPEAGVATVPASTASPFVTRTMADLYARQGYHEQALEVYRELAVTNPDDAEVASRIRELSPDGEEEHVSPEPESATDDVQTSAPIDFAAPPAEPVTEFAEPVNEFAEPADSSAGIALDAEGEHHDDKLDNEPDDKLDDEPNDELNEDMPEASAETEQQVAPVHFTEMDLSRGDEWDTDPWAAGFSPEEQDVVPLDFVPPNEFSDALAPSDPPDEPLQPVTEEHLVAYSPQLPDDDELPHYSPPGPTIREFFAALGARRPPENGETKSFTARSAVPQHTSVHAGQADEFPLASDAFSNLFPDSPVSEEDSKAAFALSGALSAQPALPARSTPAAPVAAVVPAASPAPPPASAPATQESEEDIRRFREWLDGLADS